MAITEDFALAKCGRLSVWLSPKTLLWPSVSGCQAGVALSEGSSRLSGEAGARGTTTAVAVAAKDSGKGRLGR